MSVAAVVVAAAAESDHVGISGTYSTDVMHPQLSSRNVYSSILESHQQERALAVWRTAARHDHGRSDVRKNRVHRLVLPR